MTSRRNAENEKMSYLRRESQRSRTSEVVEDLLMMRWKLTDKLFALEIVGAAL